MSNNLPRILLVDDEPFNLLLLEELLQSEGYTTSSADSGAQALRAVRDFCPDLILLDIMMPDMDGFEVCQRLRQESNLPAVPIIFLTALDDETSRLQALESMGDDYLTKPINSNLLLKKLASTWRLQQMRSQQWRGQANQKPDLAAMPTSNEQLAEKFRLFVPEQYLNRLAPKGLESIKLGNTQEAELTILFCDIRGFTAIAESQAASQTVAWLNAFFSCMEKAIAANYGFIDKFIGDAIMAIFDRPEFGAQDAIAAAVQMQSNLQEFNRDRSQYNLAMPINIGIGIHSGKATISTVGSAARMDSTVIGDAVNTASRLEQLTKFYNCPILASGTTMQKLTQPDLFRYQFVDEIAPTGKQQAIKIYQILGQRTEAIDVKAVPTAKLS